MSRLRRPLLYNRYSFVTVDLLRGRGKLEERDFGRLAIAPGRMRQKHDFLLTAWLSLPDHWHGAPTLNRVRLPAHEKARI